MPTTSHKSTAPGRQGTHIPHPDQNVDGKKQNKGDGWTDGDTRPTEDRERPTADTSRLRTRNPEPGSSIQARSCTCGRYHGNVLNGQPRSLPRLSRERPTLHPSFPLLLPIVSEKVVL